MQSMTSEFDTPPKIEMSPTAKPHIDIKRIYNANGESHIELVKTITQGPVTLYESLTPIDKLKIAGVAGLGIALISTGLCLLVRNLPKQTKSK